MTRKDELIDVCNSVNGEFAQSKALYLGLCQIADAIVFAFAQPGKTGVSWREWDKDRK